MDCQVVWNLVAPIAKRVALAPAFFRALERAVPIALDGSVLVIGLDSTVDGALQGALNSSDNLNILHKAFRDVTGLADGIVRAGIGNVDIERARAEGVGGQHPQVQAAQALAGQCRQPALRQAGRGRFGGQLHPDRQRFPRPDLQPGPPLAVCPPRRWP
mgnify:CR=1 FL=1